MLPMQNGLKLDLPSGEHTKSNGKSPFLMGKSTISMAIFNCYVGSPEGTWTSLILAQLAKLGYARLSYA